jgi:mycothiol synthase
VTSAVTTPDPFPPLPEGHTARPAVPTDLDAVFRVHADAEVLDAGNLAIEPEDIAGDWARPSMALAHDTVLVLDEHGVVVATAEVSRGGGHRDAAVHPDARGRGIGGFLIAWSERRAAELGAASLGQHVPEGSSPDRFLTGVGYRIGHTSWVLVLPEGRSVPDRELPAGYAFATAEDDPRRHAAYEVVQDAFGEWEGRGRESYDDWSATTIARPGAQPWQLRVVEHEGAVVATCFTILDSQGTGYVSQLATERTHRGRGLAQALLADAFRRARERGATSSELSTDSRTGALDLYRKVGMEPTQTWVNRVIDLPRA